jgi:hypothetical protein
MTCARARIAIDIRTSIVQINKMLQKVLDVWREYPKSPDSASVLERAPAAGSVQLA